MILVFRDALWSAILNPIIDLIEPRHFPLLGMPLVTDLVCGFVDDPCGSPTSSDETDAIARAVAQRCVNFRAIYF